VRVRSFLIAIATLLLLPSAVLGAQPDYSFVTFDDPAFDAEETAFVSDLCGFPIEAEFGGRIGFVVFDRDGAPGVVELAVYGLRGTYVNPANGKTVRIRDIGPDRFYIQDGIGYVAVTGRSEGGSGIVGVVKIDLATGEVVHEAGNEIGFAYDRICTELA
jgi:hypothetical protein